jgi:type IV secretory pathway VirB10-like protein
MSTNDDDTTGRRGAAEDLTIRAPRGRVSGLRRHHVQLAIGGMAAAVAAALVVGLGIDFRPHGPRDEAKVVPPTGDAAGPAPLADLPSTYADVATAAARPARSTRGTTAAAAACPDCGDGTAHPSGTLTPSRQADLTQAMTAIRQVGEQNQRLAAQLAAYQGELAQRREKAWASGLFFNGDNDPPARTAAAPAVPTTGTPADARERADGQSPPAAAQPTDQDRKVAFLADAPAPGVALDRPYLHAGAPYQLQAGTVIPAALLTGINTDLPGDVVAMVTAPVYDSRIGATLLVPQGARLYGGYDSHVSGNQNRALIVWHRLLMPNGRSVELDHMRGTDAAGYAGVTDAIDYHADQLALGAALSGLIAYAGNLARSGQPSTTTVGDTIGDTVAQEAARTGSRIVDRQLDAQPTITVRPGWPVRVLVNRDVTLEPYAD